IGFLGAAPSQSVAYLKERLRPAAVDDQQTARWIVALESNRFAVREQASRELEQLGDLAEAAMRQVLTRKPSLEVRRRVDSLLEKVEKGLLSGEQLQAWRAVETLEAIGNPEAKQVLE